MTVEILFFNCQVKNKAGRLVSDPFLFLKKPPLLEPFSRKMSVKNRCCCCFANSLLLLLVWNNCEILAVILRFQYNYVCTYKNTHCICTSDILRTLVYQFFFSVIVYYKCVYISHMSLPYLMIGLLFFFLVCSGARALSVT